MRRTLPDAALAPAPLELAGDVIVENCAIGPRIARRGGFERGRKRFRRRPPCLNLRLLRELRSDQPRIDTGHAPEVLHVDVDGVEVEGLSGGSLGNRTLDTREHEVPP